MGDFGYALGVRGCMLLTYANERVRVAGVSKAKHFSFIPDIVAPVIVASIRSVLIVTIMRMRCVVEIAVS